MPKKGHTEEQILGALRQVETGAEVCRKMGISIATFYLCRKKYSGLGLNTDRDCVRLSIEVRKIRFCSRAMLADVE